MAIRASVTVSMAAEMTGMAREIDLRQPGRGAGRRRQHLGLGGNEQDIVEGQTETDEFLGVGEPVERMQCVVPRTPRRRYWEQ